MAVLVKIQQFGDDLGIILPEEVLVYLDAKEGDHLEFVTTPDGLLLKRYDLQFEELMKAVRHVMAKHRDVLKMLADS